MKLKSGHLELSFGVEINATSWAFQSFDLFRAVFIGRGQRHIQIKDYA